MSDGASGWVLFLKTAAAQGLMDLYSSCHDRKDNLCSGYVSCLRGIYLLFCFW